MTISTLTSPQHVPLSMRTFELFGTACPVDAEALEIGDPAPDFVLVDADFKEQSLDAFRDRRKLILTLPSVELDGAAELVTTLSRLIDGAGAELLLVSRDLPFTQSRFVRDHALATVRTLSGFRSDGFGRAYGVAITDGRYVPLYATLVLVVDENDTVVHQQFATAGVATIDTAAVAASLGLDHPEDT